MERPPYLPSLTSLRFFAAAMIVVFHSAGNFGISTQILGYVSIVQGVTFFFILSGFVLTYVYETFENKAQFFSFLVARFARIWPLHMVTLLLSVWLIYHSIYDPSIFLVNMGMVHGWIPLKKYFFSYNSLSWAVSTEFALYLCFPFLVRNWEKTWHIKTMFVFFSLIMTIAVCNHFSLPHNPPVGIGYAGILYISPIGRLNEFCFGMVTALVYKKIKHRYQPGEKMGSVIEIAVISLAILMICQSHELALFLPPWIGDVGKYWVELGGVSSIFFAAVILVTALDKGLISNLLSKKLFIFMGEISFAIYLLHQILIQYYSHHIAGSVELSNVLVYCMFLGILLVCSYIAWAFVEKPSRKCILAGFECSKKRLMNMFVEGSNPMMARVEKIAGIFRGKRM